jgi:hypothetical protein
VLTTHALFARKVQRKLTNGRGMLAAGPSYVSPALQLKREWSPWPELGGFFKMIICDGVSEFESWVSVSRLGCGIMRKSGRQ